MKKYRVTGRIEITYTYYEVDQEIEAEDEDDALEAVCEDLEPHDADRCEFDTYGVKAVEIEPPPPETEAQRMMRLGAPMLPGFA